MLALIDPNSRVPKEHPIRAIKDLADEALRQMNRRFDAMYAEVGRPSIPPETLLKATILMALYTIRSERQFCEQLDYNILFRWFLDMDLVSLAESSADLQNNACGIHLAAYVTTEERCIDVCRDELMNATSCLTIVGN
jgi:transposase